MLRLACLRFIDVCNVLFAFVVCCSLLLFGDCFFVVLFVACCVLFVVRCL